MKSIKIEMPINLKELSYFDYLEFQEMDHGNACMKSLDFSCHDK
jgi:hypothetical protein